MYVTVFQYHWGLKKTGGAVTDLICMYYYKESAHKNLEPGS